MIDNLEVDTAVSKDLRAHRGGTGSTAERARCTAPAAAYTASQWPATAPREPPARLPARCFDPLGAERLRVSRGSPGCTRRPDRISSANPWAASRSMIADSRAASCSSSRTIRPSLTVGTIRRVVRRSPRSTGPSEPTGEVGNQPISTGRIAPRMPGSARSAAATAARPVQAPSTATPTRSPGSRAAPHAVTCSPSSATSTHTATCVAHLAQAPPADACAGPLHRVVRGVERAHPLAQQLGAEHRRRVGGQEPEHRLGGDRRRQVRAVGPDHVDVEPGHGRRPAAGSSSGTPPGADHSARNSPPAGSAASVGSLVDR
jgi:hypothetical protein